MVDVQPGDIVLYMVRTRDKYGQGLFYECQEVAGISGSVPVNASGLPFTGVRAIYRRSGAAPSLTSGKRLIPRDLLDPDEKPRIQKALGEIYGPGELISGFACPGDCACGLIRKQL